MIKTIITWVLLIGVLTVNALANILPINGMNTGEISALYPNYFVPAGFTFSIWSIIYLLLLCYTIAFSYYQSHADRYVAINSYLNTINPLYWLTCLWNMAWILAWHYLALIVSVLIMVVFLLTLILIFRKGLPLIKTFGLGVNTCLFTPFVVYFSWISVATLANITALLVYLKWQGWGINGIYWSAALIVAAIFLGGYITLRYRVAAFGAVIAWALWGIRAAQAQNDTLLNWLPLIGIFLVLTTMLIALRRKISTARVR